MVISIQWYTDEFEKEDESLFGHSLLAQDVKRRDQHCSLFEWNSSLTKINSSSTRLTRYSSHFEAEYLKKLWTFSFFSYKKFPRQLSLSVERLAREIANVKRLFSVADNGGRKALTKRREDNSNTANCKRVNLWNWFIWNGPSPEGPFWTKHHLPLDDDREEAEGHCRPRPVLHGLYCPGLIFIH